MGRTFTVLGIGDTHFPFAHWRTLDAIVKATAEIKPDVVLQLGDLLDMFSFSRFSGTVNAYTPRQEMKLGRRDAEHFWSRLKKAAPKAKRWQLIGNHDERPHKQLLGKAPEFEDFVVPALQQLFQFDGVETMPDEAEELMIQGVCYQHGFRGFGQHVRNNGVSTVTGHLHKGGVVYMRLGKKTLWEANAGYCANPHTCAMSYARQRRFATYTQGYFLSDARGPRFVPLANP